MGWQAADPHPAEGAAVLCQPTAARVVPRHHHRFHTHHIAVTVVCGGGEKEELIRFSVPNPPLAPSAGSFMKPLYSESSAKLKLF